MRIDPETLNGGDEPRCLTSADIALFDELTTRAASKGVSMFPDVEERYDQILTHVQSCESCRHRLESQTVGRTLAVPELYPEREFDEEDWRGAVTAILGATLSAELGSRDASTDPTEHASDSQPARHPHDRTTFDLPLRPVQFARAKRLAGDRS